MQQSKCQEFSTNVSLVAKANQTTNRKIPEHAQKPLLSFR